jgi:hypothetical protein
MARSLRSRFGWTALAAWMLCAVVAYAPAGSAASPRTACDLLSPAEVQQVLGKPGEVQYAQPTLCQWFAPMRRMLSISVDSALLEPTRQLAMLRNWAQRMSPKHTFQDEPTVGPLAFSETTTIHEWLVKFVKGRRVVVVKLDDAPGGLEATRTAARLVYAKL